MLEYALALAMTGGGELPGWWTAFIANPIMMVLVFGGALGILMMVVLR
ncbi:hypothetical protein O2N63_00290 [Aliiroseovarius sp. KMU-50]|uniref:Uncharacterized protein n=1 Tax=Aliiroseovarius salicola TaxID=3009082 RepID=A0ABT4VW98_9RHOB|nr:hypothetical protein [Aliiroseovarius sp. KMU-50]MDA5092527.1 hypothetical protein [Aliiroseovarius sp. KMU-50]